LDVIRFSDVAVAIGMHFVHDVGVEASRHHQSKPPAIQESQVDPPGRSLGDEFRHESPIAGYSKVACQQVFRSQGKDRQGQIRKSVDQVADRSIASRGDKANQAAAPLRPIETLGQSIATGKEARPNAVLPQMRAQCEDFGTLQPVPRRRVSLHGHPRTAHKFE
jgi:hypothetical protein